MLHLNIAIQCDLSHPTLFVAPIKYQDTNTTEVPVVIVSCGIFSAISNELGPAFDYAVFKFGTTAPFDSVCNSDTGTGLPAGKTQAEKLQQ